MKNMFMGHKKERIKDKLCILVLLSYAILSVLPVMWLALSSLKSAEDISSYPPKIFFTPTLETYDEIVSQGILKYLGNSLVISISTMFLTLGISLPASYVFSRTKFKGSQNLAFWVLSTRMIPPIVVCIPIFLTAYILNLFDTHLIVTIMYSGFNLCFAIWMLRGVFDGIPAELDEAAMVDGTTRMGALIRIVLPLAATGIIATSVFIFIMSWNEFPIALVLTSVNAVTSPVFLATSTTWYYVKWGRLFASCVLTIVPPIALSIIIQKYIIKALTFGYA